MNDPSVDPLFELRVLEGEQQGAHRRVQAGVAVTVGAGLDSDVVLRGVDFGERRIRLTALGDAVQLDVLEGEVAIGEQAIRAGEHRRIALRTRVQLGSTAIGIGPAEEGDWSLAAAGAAAAPAAPELAPAPPVAANARAHRPPRKWWQLLVAGGGALAAVSMGMLAFALSATPSSQSGTQQAAQTEAALRAAGLPPLTVYRDTEGRLVISGHLESAAQRARVEQLLAGAPSPVRLEVWVDEQVTNAVQDVYRVNGVAATAQGSGRGVVQVSTREADAVRLERIGAIARRDVPGLTSLEVRNQPPPALAQRAAPAVVDDPGKRVAAIVSGNPPEVPPYLVTADGTRYFEGALLPTGHRIAAIGQHEVLLEKDGARTPLVF